MKRACIVIIMLISTMLLGQTLPSVPATITYQGRIEDIDFPLGADGEYEMTFLIFDALTGGNLLWSETQPGVMVTGGMYRVNLGEVEPIEFSALKQKNAYLEVRVFGVVLSPRKRIVTAPFALKAEGEVPEGGIILGQATGDTNILNLGYTQEGSTVGTYYLYKKNAYNPASPRVPQRIAYQGRVKRTDGGPAGSSAEITFTIYDSDTAGTAAWTETQNDVPLGTDGLYSVELGSVNSVYPVDLVQKDLWLAVSVNGEPLNPREKLTSAAYALKIESPVPTGGVVLSATGANAELAAKRFTVLAGATVEGYYPFIKSAFSAADPSVPLLINYQGRLLNASGLPITDSRDMNFSIYDTLAGSTLLWAETITGVALSSGIYDVLLGSGSTISPSTFNGPNAFLEVKVIQGATIETLTPRQRLTSVPFALQAEGALPTTALILGAAANDPNLTDSGFQMTGDTVNGYYVYGKTDVDTTPPELVIVEPEQMSGYSAGSVPVIINYSDDLSGINTSSFEAYLNGDTVMTSFTITGSGATATLDADTGENILVVSIMDNAGNKRLRQSLFYMDKTGTPPVVTIASPLDGTTIDNNTPEIRVEFYDDEGGLDLASLSILINGVDRTSLFNIQTEGAVTTAIWQVPFALSLPDGSNQIFAFIKNCVGLGDGTTAQVAVNNAGTTPLITGMQPVFGFAGDTVTITGTGFSNTLSENDVYFFSAVKAEITSGSATQLIVHVPSKAMSGYVDVQVKGKAAQGAKILTIGLKYGFVANYDNSYINNGAAGMVSVIDFDTTSPGTWLNRIPCGSKPFDVAVSPDGRTAYVSDNTGNKIYIMDATGAADSDTLRGTINITGPRYVTFSPDGIDVFVGSENGYLYTIRNNLLRPEITKFLGNQLNNMTISPIHQFLYVLRNTSTSTRGNVYFLNLDKSETFLDTVHGSTVYRKPVGVLVTPDQSKLLVANNRSDASSKTGSQWYSFSSLDASLGTYLASYGARVLPSRDNHDVNWPFEMITDPRGQLVYSSFAEGFAGISSSDSLGVSNNVGVQKFPFGTDFDAATASNFYQPNRSPKGLATAPGGELIFVANFGIYQPGQGDKIMILDHKRIKNAIDNDTLTQYPYDQFNLSGTDPESLDQINTYFQNKVVREVSGFDGPRNIAFQEFPVIEIYPQVIHLAQGGVNVSDNLIKARVHPIYGDMATIGLSNGTTINISSSSLIPTWHQQWFGPGRDVYFTSTGANNWNTLFASGDPGIGKIIADVNGYPSNVAFVTVPPQNNIQMMVGEQLISSSNALTQLCFISIVRNRLRLPKRIDHDNNQETSKVSFAFPSSIQITAENASEELVAQQMFESIDCDTFNTACSWAGDSYITYINSRQRSVLDGDTRLYHDQRMVAYDLGVDYAGQTMLDLLRTGMDMDSYDDPTDGCFSFFSPSAAEWDEHLGDEQLSIEEVLNGHGTTGDFPNANNLIYDRICGINTPTNRGMLYYFCDNTVQDNSSSRGKYIQIVVVNGAATYGDSRPHFVFIRLRSPGDPSVVRVN